MSASPAANRVTQSFVGTLAWCWRRPELTALEVLWRWAYGVPVLLLLRHEVLQVLSTAALDYKALREITLLDPMKAAAILGEAMLLLLPPVKALATWLLPGLLVSWIIVSSIGRTIVLRKIDHALSFRPVTLIMLQTVRMIALSASFLVWFWCLQGAVSWSITGPIARGDDPSLVSYFALAIISTLGLFTLWAIGSWGFAVAPLLAMMHGWNAPRSLVSAFRIGSLKIKLIELNLVMGIVKIALLVLAVVFSASPLPFETVASKGFLAWWWAGVMLLYFVASDFFHVARLAAYLELWRSRHA